MTVSSPASQSSYSSNYVLNKSKAGGILVLNTYICKVLYKLSDLEFYTKYLER